MCLLPASPYAEWRRLSGAILYLNDGPDPPPERLLQAIWFHQRLHRDRLRTEDGRGLQVLHPGFWNRERGPDFRGAMLQFDNGPAHSGDIEIDLRCHDWHAHRHDASPGYRNVILHVVWEAQGDCERPTLALRSVLDSPLPELATWLGTEAAVAFPWKLQGQCRSPLEQLGEAGVAEVLRQAALLRFQAKAFHFQARARQTGWDQALWEGLFGGLGYKHNFWPMQRLAELLPRLCPRAPCRSLLEIQARLLGAAGLLPEELTRARTGAGADRYLRQLWDCWWREREEYQAWALPGGLWQLSGQRPANQPHRRLALAAHWLANDAFLGRIEAWCTSPLVPRRAPAALREVMRVPLDSFWSWHWTLRSRRLDRARPLLGSARVTDLAVNVILPWLWVRAVEGKNDSLQSEMERRYFAWPAAEDNAVLRLARHRLLGSNDRALPRTAAAQQGLLQIVRDFCERANAICADCRFPELIRQWPAPTQPAPLPA